MRKVKRALAFAVAAVMACTSLAACSAPTRNTAESNTPAASGSASQTTAKTKEQDTLIFAQGADPRGLDPALVDDGESSKIIVNVYEGLLKYAKDSTKVEPCLAESWDVSADGLTYTFHLKKGVNFRTAPILTQTR